MFLIHGYGSVYTVPMFAYEGVQNRLAYSLAFFLFICRKQSINCISKLALQRRSISSSIPKEERFLPIISLFCGPGGLDEGFKQAGYSTLLAYDSQQHCVNTHARNHPEAIAVQTDLAVIDPEDIIRNWKERSSKPPVGLIGGPPCQAFSFANIFKREDDVRAKLVERYAEIITALKAVWSIHFFVFENVTGLLGPNHRKWYNRFIELVQQAGFEVFPARLNAVHFGVPQHRERIFLVGLNNRLYPDQTFSFPKGNATKLRTVRQAIGKLPKPTYFQRNLNANDLPHHPNHWCMQPKSHRFSNGSIIPGDTQSSRSFRALAWDRPSFTVAYGNLEVHVHPNCKRRLSVYESMLLQGFPKDYVLVGDLSQQFSMVSDAVSPPVARAIAQALLEQLHFRS